MIHKSKQILVWQLLCFFCCFFSDGKWGIPLLVWVYPLLFLWLISKEKTKQMWLFLYLCLLVSFVCQWYKVIGMGFWLCLIAGLVMSALKLICYVIYGKVMEKKQPFWQTLILPMLMCTIAYLIYCIYPIAGGLSEGYTQYANLTLMQLTTVFGIYGIIFLIYWTAAVCVWLFERQAILKACRRKVLLFGGVWLIVVLWGNGQLYWKSDHAENVRIASLTVPIKESLETDEDISKVFYSESFTEENYEKTREKLSSIHEALFEKTVKEARAGAKIVMWSELNGAVLAQDEMQLIERGKQVAMEEKIYLVMNLLVKTPYETYKDNKVVVIDPEGKQLTDYYKYGRSIGEWCKKGDGKLQTFDTPYGRMAPIICSDAAFSDRIRQVGRARVAILLIPSSDWQEMSPFAKKVAITRGIENGCSIVRQANMGISISADPFGHILSQNDYYQGEDKTMVSIVPVYRRKTLYPYIGPILPWGAIVGLVVFARDCFRRKEHISLRS